MVESSNLGIGKESQPFDPMRPKQVDTKPAEIPNAQEAKKQVPASQEAQKKQMKNLVEGMKTLATISPQSMTSPVAIATEIMLKKPQYLLQMLANARRKL